jgi:hypothetical protein
MASQRTSHNLSRREGAMDYLRVENPEVGSSVVGL